ncbi:hypothetical protein [Kordiimonas sp. SCSIO 12610]|uniref:hypothetical protein n=1 Tax=Kordiimonas sp. SCSIO 12610 TaxID=2829597 RepID=UPI00210E970B|nr:hypothetical protein [Kordiimonas sp. SCSIO 12610]UTW56157.1 hypothetical protein KFF44_04475 [Kordiimonas sp. SCSIO 12610]
MTKSQPEFNAKSKPKIQDEWLLMPFRDMDKVMKYAIACNLEADMRRERGNIIFLEGLLVFLAVGWSMTGGIGKGAVTLVLGLVPLGYHLWQRRLRTRWLRENEQALNWYRVHAEQDLRPTPLYRWMLGKYWPGLVFMALILALLFTLNHYGLVKGA